MQNLSETQVIIIVALSLTLLTLLILCIGVIAPYWVYREASGTRYYQGLWQSCTHVDSYEECVDISKTGWLEVALALELVGLILVCLAIIGFFIHIFILRGNKVLYVIIAVILFIAGVFILVGAAIYASNVGTSVGNIHFAFALCLAASVLAVIVAFIMLVYLLFTKTSKKDMESGGDGPGTSQWIAPRNRSAHKSRASLLRDTDDSITTASETRARSRASGRNEAGPSSAIAEDGEDTQSERASSATRSESGRKKSCCLCCYCCCKDSDEEDDHQDNNEENPEVEVLQEYDENEEINEERDNDSAKQHSDEKPDSSEQKDESEQAQSSDNTNNYQNQETQPDSKDKKENSEKTEDDSKDTNKNSKETQGSQTFKSVTLVDINEQHEDKGKETVVYLEQDDAMAAPTESNTDEPEESLYAQVHPEPSADQQNQTATHEKQQETTTKENETGSKTSLKEDETLVVIPEDDAVENKNSKKRGTVFKFRRPPLKRSKSDGTVLKAKVQLYEVSPKDNKLILVSSDYVPDEDIQSIASSQQTSATGIRQADDSDSDDKNSLKDKDSSDFEDDIEEEKQSGEYKTIKIKTRKRTKRIKVKGVFGEPVLSPYGYTNANNDHRQIVRYLKTSPYFSSLPPQPVKPRMSPSTDHEKPKWKI